MTWTIIMIIGVTVIVAVAATSLFWLERDEAYHKGYHDGYEQAERIEWIRREASRQTLFGKPIDQTREVE